MKVDIWYGESKEFDTNGHEYVVLILDVPPLEQDMRNALVYLQTVEKIHYDVVASDFKLFDVHSSRDGENATISVIVPIKSEKLAKVIHTLNMIEKRLEEESFNEMKRKASKK